ncbi:MAG: hypothetical protein ACRBK7_22260 [Acidimicrobiales bacterium]
MFLPVDPEEFNDSILTVLKYDGVMEFNDDEFAEPVQQLHRKSKLPLWAVTVSYEHEADFEPENCQVRIASSADPGLTPGPVRFGGLAFRTWNMNGKKGLSISADTWTQEPNPSTKRAAKTSPPQTPPKSGDVKADVGESS